MPTPPNGNPKRGERFAGFLALDPVLERYAARALCSATIGFHMGQTDWETTGAIGLGILIAAGAASLGVWKTTFERKAEQETVAKAANARTQALPRSLDDARRMRTRAQPPGAGVMPNLPPGHPPVNLPAPAAP